MKQNPKRHPPQTAAEIAVILRSIAGEALGRVIREGDIDRYARLLAGASDVDRGQAMNEFFNEMSERLEQALSRMMQRIAAQHPNQN